MNFEIKNLSIDGQSAVKIMRCLKEHEPKIWEMLREAVTEANNQKFSTGDQVSLRFDEIGTVLGYNKQLWGSSYSVCIEKATLNEVGDISNHREEDMELIPREEDMELIPRDEIEIPGGNCLIDRVFPGDPCFFDDDVSDKLEEKNPK